MNILWLNVVGPRTGKFITSESTNKHFIYIACHSRKMHSNINPKPIELYTKPCVKFSYTPVALTV